MRDYIAGILTALVFLALYFVVPGMFSRFKGHGTSVPKSLEIVILLSDTFVNYFYVLLPLLFFTLRFVIGLVVPDSGKPTITEPGD
jgi:type II secretory pathway component PulF